jgi:PTH1 family peptidyl-tRNA hydrolase
VKLVAGLGNPGKKYDRTPHNIGFAAIDELAARLSCTLKRSLRFRARTGKAAVGDENLLLAKPWTYMNRSGAAVSSLMRYHRLTPAEMIVVLDDADLETGRLRVRNKGSSGGHRGLESIIRSVKNEDFVRIRIGVGRSSRADDLIGHILSPFASEKWEEMQNILGRAAEAVLCVVESGVDEAMNRFNGMTFGPGGNENARMSGRVNQ